MSKSTKSPTQPYTDDETSTGEARPRATEVPPPITYEPVHQEIGAWQQNKRINGLWSKDQTRNSWVSIDGVGWRKLANKSDSVTLALTVLATHAVETGSLVNYREEADQMIHEIYVW